jgi:glutaredoxin
MRCSAHDLALGPDGQCVLCRKASRRPPRTRQQRAIWMLAGVVVLLAAVAAAWAVAKRPAAPALVTPNVTTPEPEPVPGEEQPDPSEATPATRRDRQPAATETATAPAAEPSAAALDAGPVQNRPPPDPAQITQALRSTPVTMFTTQWCGVCTRARNFFRANQIPFKERDIDRSAADRQELLALTGKTSIPYIDIDGQRISGFGEASVSEALRRSVERRLGVKGLTIRSSAP